MEKVSLLLDIAVIIGDIAVILMILRRWKE
jgi:hypothetical protein|nr:MAG TPA: hypothetical protein [Caudoviricetes sp.]DAO70725.1 MAG TPA: hypothetical protein [Caudoviricetes sp.]DAT91932.1 MAG TPA: hypothetical protein [Caudoviricetes sp.]